MVKYCPSCGEALVDNANFCKSCGASLNGASRANVPERPAVEKSYTIHIIVAYILALFIPLLGVILGVYLMTRKDSKSANKHGKYAIIVAVVIFFLSFISLLRY